MTRFREVLRILSTHRVDFIVVGGISALLNGAPINTLDLDIVHARDPENVARLLGALEELDAGYRYTGGRKLTPNKSHMTRFGPLDVLGMIGSDLSYEDLLAHSTELLVADSLKARVLTLETLIEIKERLGAEKDRLALPLLRRTLEERRESSGRQP